MVVIFMLFTFGIGFSLGKELSKRDNKNTSKEETPVEDDKKEETPVEVNNNLDFNFEGMANNLKTQLASGGYQAVKLSCTETPGPEGELPTINSTGTRISNESIDVVINKLKTANSIETGVTAGWIGECMPKKVAYIISVNDDPASNEFQNNKVFNLYYADDTSILLISYEGIGYAFHFNSSADTDNFIESLN